MLLLNLLRKYPHPIISTSANIAGQVPLQNHEEIRIFFGNKIQNILKGKIAKNGLGSTIAQVEKKEIIIFRKGRLWQELKKFGKIHLQCS